MNAGLRDELTQLLTALWHEIDHADGARVSVFFTANAELRLGNAVFHGTAAIDAVYAARAARGPRVSRHLISNVHVLRATGDSAHVISNLVLYAEDGPAPRPTTTPALIADVRDRFVRRDGVWLIDSRHLQNLFIAPGTVLAVPTE